MSDLFSLVYISRSLIGARSERLDALARVSRARNESSGLTGALICSPSYFAQIIEGPEASLEATFDRIQTDTRHEDIEVLYLIPIAERQFGNWGMASAGVLQDDEEIQDVLDVLGDRLTVENPDAVGKAAMNLLRRILCARELI